MIPGRLGGMAVNPRIRLLLLVGLVHELDSHPSDIVNIFYQYEILMTIT